MFTFRSIGHFWTKTFNTFIFQRCLESLIQRYGTGLEDVVSKEREFERLIEAYQVFMRGDKKKMQRKVERKQQSARKLKVKLLIMVKRSEKFCLFYS